MEKGEVPRNEASPIEADPTIPWRYAVSYAFSQRDGLAKTLLGEDVYKTFQELMKDKTPGILSELLPYVSRVKMYDGVHKRYKKFAHWKPEQQANYIRDRTGGKPLNTHDRDKLVAMAIIDMFFKEKVGKIKLS